MQPIKLVSTLTILFSVITITNSMPKDTPGSSSFIKCQDGDCNDRCCLRCGSPWGCGYCSEGYCCMVLVVTNDKRFRR